MSAFVAVRRAGPNHHDPDAWLRLDAAGAPCWQPRADPASIAGMITEMRERGVKATTTLAVQEIATGLIVWREDQAQPEALGEPEQLALI